MSNVSEHPFLELEVPPKLLHIDAKVSYLIEHAGTSKPGIHYLYAIEDQLIFAVRQSRPIRPVAYSDEVRVSADTRS